MVRVVVLAAVLELDLRHVLLVRLLRHHRGIPVVVIVACEVVLLLVSWVVQVRVSMRFVRRQHLNLVLAIEAIMAMRIPSYAQVDGSVNVER